MATDSEPDAWVRRRSASGPRFSSVGGTGGAVAAPGAAAAAGSSAVSPLRRFGAARRPATAVEETQRMDEDEDEHGGEGDDEDEEELDDDAMTQDILADTPESPETPSTPPMPEHNDSAGPSSPPPPPQLALLTSPPRTAAPLVRSAAEPAPAVVQGIHRQTMMVTDQAEVAAAAAPATVAANMSPPEASAVSGEDDDYRSETSSEVSSSRGFRPRKHITSSCADYNDLSARLRRAVLQGADTIGFDESLIGADVVLCVRRRKDRLPRRKRIPRHSDSDEDEDDDMTQDCLEDDKPEIQRFYAHRFMLAASSAPFKAMLTGRMRESKEREVEIRGIDAPIVEKMLLFIYTGEVVLDLDNVVGLVIASEMYELDALREMCKGFVLNHAHEVFRDPQIVQVPEKILLELIQQDELQIRELTLMEALVMWGEARTPSNNRLELGSVLHDMMEFVRFPTMSVSDLYGKVRPLVRDGVIDESLLTEALFHHLKWGSQLGQASVRTKPRQLTASLRKRKRVSFIQHVSFVPTT